MKLFFSFSLALLATVAPAQYAIDWFTVASGGGSSAGGDFALRGTIGQPDAGAMSGGSFTLSGGFWAVAFVQSPGAPMMSLQPAGSVQATLDWTPNTPGFQLQTSDTLVPALWTNAPSGTNHPVTVPTTAPMKYYRLVQP